jgi:hypothetical protein
MKIVSSGAALDLVLALTQRREGARLAELATAASLSLSTAQSAMRLLLTDGLVERGRGGRPRYRLRTTHPAHEAVVRLAARYATPSHTTDIALRANPSVEFAARDRSGYVAVEHPVADPRDLAALEHLARLIGGDRGGPRIQRYAHQDVVATLGEDATLRRRAAAATLLKGSLERSFPAPAARRRRGPRSSALLRQISRRALARIARAHGLRRIRLFGSAARGSLGPGSDLDLLIEPRPDAQISFLDLARLEGDLESVLGRHVDIVTLPSLRPDVRERVALESVTLVG